MAPPQKNETAEDSLKKTLSDLAQASVLPDADIQFLTQIQQMIIEHLRARGSGQQQQSGLAPPGQPPGGGAPGGMPPGGAAPGGIGAAGMGAMNAGGGMPGLNPMGSQGQQPTSDELMRVLSQAGAGGSNPNAA